VEDDAEKDARYAVDERAGMKVRKDADRLVKSWARGSFAWPPASEHARLEIANAVHLGHRPGDAPPLTPGAAVPRCSCFDCIGGKDRASHFMPPPYTITEYARKLEEIAPDLPEAEKDRLVRRERIYLAHNERQLEARHQWPISAVAADHPPHLSLRRRKKRRELDPLPVDDARAVPILEVVSRLGLGEPRRAGKEYVLPCPLHDDSRPSLRLNPERGLWHCFPCGEGGDGIRLVERVRGVTFAAAVRELVG
jgi:hypothetical protein